MTDPRDAGPSFLYEPQVPDLRALIRDLLSGNLAIPRFQRRFQWRAEHRLDLFRSIWEGIPLGTILVWRTQESTYRTFEHIGPHRPPRPQPGSLLSYVLDGHQRLTTLLSALVPLPAGAAVAPPPDDSTWPIYYALDADPPDFLVLAPGEAPSATMFPLHAALDGRAVLGFQRGLAARADADALIARCDELVGRIRDFKIPIIPLFTRDGRIAKDSFVRMNKPIAPMSELDLVNAARSTNGDELDERIAALKDAHLAAHGWGTVSDRLLLDTCKLLLGLDLQDTDPRQLALEMDQRSDVLDEATRCLARAARLLDTWGVSGPTLVPYPQLAAMLSLALRAEATPSVPMQQALARWFWHTLYGLGDAGFNVTATRRALERLKAVMRTPDDASTLPPLESLRPLPTRLSLNHARPRALLLHWLRLYRQADKRLTFRSVSTVPDADLYLAPLYDKLPNRSQRNTFGNRILTPPEHLLDLRQTLTEPVALARRDVDTVLAWQPQLVDDGVLDALTANDPVAVVHARNHVLARLEWAHLHALGVLADGVPPAVVPDGSPAGSVVTE